MFLARPNKTRGARKPDCKRGMYWGRGGAGMMFICSEDSTVLLLLRSPWVIQGETWGFAGGSLEEEYFNTPIQNPILDDDLYLRSALQETKEECGSLPPAFRMTQILGQTEYEDCGFRYITFIVDLDKAQKDAWQPESLDGETDEFRWVSLDQVKPGAIIGGRALHFGVEFTIAHPEYARIRQSRARPNKTRYQTEKGEDFVHPLFSQLDQMAHEKLPNGAPRYHFFMHDLPKVGLNPTATYNTTPLGIYGYLLTPSYLHLLRTNELPYVTDANFVTILEATEPQRMLYVDYNPALPPMLNVDPILLKHDNSQCDQIFEAINQRVTSSPLWGQDGFGTRKRVPLKVKQSVDDDLISMLAEGLWSNYLRRMAEARQGLAAKAPPICIAMKRNETQKQAIWELIAQHQAENKLTSSLYQQYRATRNKHLPKKKPFVDPEKALQRTPAVVPARMTTDLIDQGYTSVCDAGTSVIHANEPAQIVFLTPSSFKVVETLPNIYKQLSSRQQSRETGELIRRHPEAWREVKTVFKQDEAINIIERLIDSYGLPSFDRPEGWLYLTGKPDNGKIKSKWVSTKKKPADLTAKNAPAYVPYFHVEPTILELISIAKTSDTESYNRLLKVYFDNPQIQVSDLIGSFPDDPVRQHVSDNAEDMMSELLDNIRDEIENGSHRLYSYHLQTQKIWPYLSSKGDKFVFVPNLNVASPRLKNYLESIAIMVDAIVRPGPNFTKLKNFLRKLEKSTS